MNARNDKPGRVTLRDVAALAGVSVQTASHVMAGNMTVRLPESTRERVRAAAATLHYRPNRHAVAIRRGKTDVIGIWMPINRPIITYLRMLQAVSECANSSGYELMIVGLDRSEAVRPNGSVPADWPVDGIMTIDSGKAAERYRSDGSTLSTPICVLGLEQVANGDRVCWDLRSSVEQSVKTMIERGRTRVVHVTPRWIMDGFPREQRRLAYTTAMEEAGLEPRFIPCDDEASPGAHEAVARWLAEGNTADGFFGFTDTCAVGAAKATLKAGLRIPEDIAVWGVGDYPTAMDFNVPISTISAPITPIIQHAWQFLIERIEGKAPDENRLHMFPMSFVERDSTLV